MKINIKSIENKDYNFCVNLIGMPNGSINTLATMLRRYSLTSALNFAPVAIYFDNLTNEFINSDNFIQTTIQIIHNIKNIKLVSNDNIKFYKLSIKTKIGKIYLSDFSCDNEISFINPELFLFESSNEGLNFDIYVALGSGYCSKEDNIILYKELINADNLLFIDANFSSRVKFVSAESFNENMNDSGCLYFYSDSELELIRFLQQGFNFYNDICSNLYLQIAEFSGKKFKSEYIAKASDTLLNILVDKSSLSRNLANKLLESGIKDLKQLTEYSIVELLDKVTLSSNEINILKTLMNEYDLYFIKKNYDKKN